LKKKEEEWRWVEKVLSSLQISPDFFKLILFEEDDTYSLCETPVTESSGEDEYGLSSMSEEEETDVILDVEIPIDETREFIPMKWSLDRKRMESQDSDSDGVQPEKKWTKTSEEDEEEKEANSEDD